jgi:hypothetical protein
VSLLARPIPQRAVLGWFALAGLLLLLAAPAPTSQFIGLAALAVVGFLALRRFALPLMGAVRPGVTATVRRRRATHQAALRLRDPDAPGHARPRAPGASPAA